MRSRRSISPTVCCLETSKLNIARRFGSAIISNTDSTEQIYPNTYMPVKAYAQGKKGRDPGGVPVIELAARDFAPFCRARRSLFCRRRASVARFAALGPLFRLFPGLTDFVKLVIFEQLASKAEHLGFFFLDVMFHVLAENLNLGLELLVRLTPTLEHFHETLGAGVLRVRFKHVDFVFFLIHTRL